MIFLVKLSLHMLSVEDTAEPAEAVEEAPAEDKAE